jgi:hypothetical protein
LLEVLARAGKPERAASFAEKLRVGHEKDSAFLICAARCYAQCSRAATDEVAQQRYLKTALDDLQMAVEQGYKDVATLTSDPELDPIRESPAFKSLLEKIGKPRSSAVSSHVTG